MIEFDIDCEQTLSIIGIWQETPNSL
jgi:hypothetical protein